MVFVSSASTVILNNHHNKKIHREREQPIRDVTLAGVMRTQISPIRAVMVVSNCCFLQTPVVPPVSHWIPVVQIHLPHYVS